MSIIEEKEGYASYEFNLSNLEFAKPVYQDFSINLEDWARWQECEEFSKEELDCQRQYLTTQLGTLNDLIDVYSKQ